MDSEANDASSDALSSDSEAASFGSTNAPVGSPRVHWAASVPSTSDSTSDASFEDEDEEPMYHTIWTDPFIQIDPPSASRNWYVVTKGRRLGVFDNW